ncbi:lytic transglycosylase domain-containing protein [Alkalicoccobacillus porphyridii]|uniref:Lytic transglycosylase domain-containing protein n=1 Tax=Alkalicoccobacillus porphyridii TaxID=2597270 RepID=A0A553ZUX6_9BACI|nr:lytic transglycosylase domain-containing protein [Alkalicoccobacillus porphyridii]TSB45125.1 lytic transglycosylase domain-containing protein [Alkalicoccobacillus porphyridii]
MKKLIIIVLTGIVVLVAVFIYLFEDNSQVRQFTYKTVIGQHQIPEKFLPIYQEAADEYNIPWKLLASVHRVETIFSTMDPMESPVGALGPFQFMPRTWVGWSHPGGDVGELPDDIDITDVDLIEEHNGYGVDVAGKGAADPFDIYDSAYAAASYLADHGASDGDLEGALYSYNRSDEYVEEVMGYYQAYNDDYELITIPLDKEVIEQASLTK